MSIMLITEENKVLLRYGFTESEIGQSSFISIRNLVFNRINTLILIRKF